MEGYNYVCDDLVLHVISRKKAKELGMKHFFTGKACKRGHFHYRDVKSGTCQKCSKDRSIRYHQENKEALRETKRKWVERNKERVAGYKKKYRDKNSETLNRKRRENYEINREAMREYHRKWRENNKEHLAEYVRKYQEMNRDYLAERSKQYYMDNIEHFINYRKENRDEILKRQKEWRENNKEHLAQYRKDNNERRCEYNRKWVEENRERVNERARDYYRQSKKDPDFIAKWSMRNMLARVLKLSNTEKKDRTENLLGYSGEELARHIESLMLEGMSFEEKNFHIDHIYPISRYLSEGVADPSVINALSNLAPMYPEDNLSKGAKPLQEWLEERGEGSREWKLYSRLLHR